MFWSDKSKSNRIDSVAVIGLSSFGSYLCKYLSEHDVDVLAIDIDEQAVGEVKDYVKKAVIADARNRETLKSLSLDSFDYVVVSVGERIDTSILITLHLKELGVQEIIAKAFTADHAKILDRVGATEIIFPERDMAERLAKTLKATNLLDFITLGEDYSIVEIAPPTSWEGKSFKDLDIRRQYGVQVILVRETVPVKTIMLPDGDYVVKSSDILVILGANADIDAIQKLK